MGSVGIRRSILRLFFDWGRCTRKIFELYAVSFYYAHLQEQVAVWMMEYNKEWTQGCGACG